MSADEPWVIFSARQKFYFLKKVQRLRIVGTDAVRIAVELLRKGNQHAEVSRLPQFRQLESLQFVDALSSHTGGLEMFGGAGCAFGVVTRYEFAIFNQVGHHANVLSTHRTVSNRH